MLIALSADRYNLQSDLCGKGPFIERVTYGYLDVNHVVASNQIGQ